MAVDPHDGHFFLPSQFLTDDDFISENQPIHHKGSPETRTPFTWEISSSALSSPVELEMGSTRTESEDEDYIAELTRKMSLNMLQEDIDSENTKSWGSADSPQSTLWSALGSNRGSPLPATPITGKADTWDLLSCAAEKFQTMKLNDEGPRFHHGQIHSSTSLEPTPSLADLKKKKNSNVSIQSNQTLTHDQLRAIQFYQLKQQQLMKQQLHHMKNTGRACGGFGNGRAERSSRPLGLSSSAWPPPQQQKQSQRTGSGMRAIFLTGSGSGTGSRGTGVFLPPGLVNTSESRKKPGCSTVLIPAKVVQALKLHFDNMGSLSPYNAGGFPLQHEEASMGGSNGAMFSQQKRHTQKMLGMNNHEMGLPQEWTY